MANFGIGLGSFLQGVTNGAQAYANIQDLKAKSELRNAQLEDLRQSRTDKQTVRDLSKQGMDAAKSNTDGQIDNVMAYYMKNTAPQLQQHWMETGDVDKANAFGKWIQTENVQAGMRSYASMVRSAMQGDVDGFANNLVKTYNQPGYLDNGYTVSSAKVMRDDKNNPSGFEVVLRDNKGKETTQKFKDMNDVYKLAMTMGAPDQVFKMGVDQLQAGQKASLEVAKEGREWQRTVAGKQIDQTNKLEGQNNESQLRQAEEAAKAKSGLGSNVSKDANATIALLKQHGYSDDYIKQNIPRILKLNNRERPETSRVDDYIKMQLESGGREFKKLSQAEQIAQAKAYIAAVDAQAQPKGAGLTPTTTNGNPTQTQGVTPGAGLMFYDTKTGRYITQ